MNNQETSKERQDDYLRALIRPMTQARYEVDYGFNHVEMMVDSLTKDYGLNLTPDFQRGHVWTQEQQERFIESVIRGTVASNGLLIQFNHPGWDEKPTTGDLPNELQCIDGLQRLTAIRRFVAGEIKAFGMACDEFEGSRFGIRRYRFRIAVFDFQNKADLLQYYLDINSGGTQHSAQELERVQSMLADIKNGESNPQTKASNEAEVVLKETYKSDYKISIVNTGAESFPFEWMLSGPGVTPAATELIDNKAVVKSPTSFQSKDAALEAAHQSADYFSVAATVQVETVAVKSGLNKDTIVFGHDMVIAAVNIDGRPIVILSETGNGSKNMEIEDCMEVAINYAYDKFISKTGIPLQDATFIHMDGDEFFTLITSRYEPGNSNKCEIVDWVSLNADGMDSMDVFMNAYGDLGQHLLIAASRYVKDAPEQKSGKKPK